MSRKGLSKEQMEARWDAVAEGVANPETPVRNYEVKLTTAEQQKRWTERAARNETKKAKRKTAMEKIAESEAKRIARNHKKNQKHAEETKVYTVRVYKDSPLMVATEQAATNAGKQPGQYLRQALIEKLQRDGYFEDDNQEE